jgi:hypothetical protein
MHPEKYLGDPTKIIYRSSWEGRYMLSLDHDPNVIGWSSEEVVILYESPVDKRYHRYFPDFLVKRRKGNIIETSLIEIKPYHQVKTPVKGNKTRRIFFNEVTRFGINDSKWKAATIYCKKRGWNFKILTEKELFS